LAITSLGQLDGANGAEAGAAKVASMFESSFTAGRDFGTAPAGLVAGAREGAVADHTVRTGDAAWSEAPP
jgi:hypothetical protein